MKRIYAKQNWRPTSVFILSMLTAAMLASAAVWVVVFKKQQILIFVDKTKPFLEKLNNKGYSNVGRDTKSGPLSDAFTRKKIVELSNLTKEH